MEAFNDSDFKSQNSTTAKLFIVGILVIVCVVPSFFVWILLKERTNRQDEARREITSKWGSNEIIAGPILSLPYDTATVDAQGLRHESSGVLNVLPQQLTHAATMDPEIRSRGIFDAIVYTAKIEGQGTFTLPDFQHTNIKASSIQWDKAYIAIPISDTRGITKEVGLQWNGSHILFEPGSKNTIIGESGIHAFVPVDPVKKSFNFAYTLDLRGSDQLEFLPLGSETKVDIKANWNSPSFTGAYLPNERKVSDGFSAHWLVSSFGRSYPQQWVDRGVDPQNLPNSRFGVSLLHGVDFYTKTDRTIKYAVMFIAITFLAFFLFDILSKLRIHPFQYLFVGFALVLFYLLLLAF